MRNKTLKPFPNGFVLDNGGLFEHDVVFERRTDESMADTLNRALNDLCSTARRELRDDMQPDGEEKPHE